MEIFNTILEYPLINVLVAIYHGLNYLHIPGALGLSIILSTVLIRLILYPFTVSQINASKKMQEIQPHLNKLKEKHKGDTKRLQQEQMALFKQHNINPAAGCLPSLVQIVILLFGFYPAIMKIIDLKPQAAISVINKIVYFDFLKLNHVWSTDFFGLPLGKTPADLVASAGYLIVIVPIATALLQFLLSKMMIVPVKPAVTTQPAPGKKSEPDFSQALQTQMLYMTPFIIGIVSFRFAIGLSLYWNTFTIFGIIQQYQVQGLGGLAGWVNKLKWKK